LLLREDPGRVDILDEFVIVSTRIRRNSDSLDIGRDRCDAFAAFCDNFFRGCELLPGGAPETARQISLLRIPPLPFILALSSTILF
jgi:hypothetical protein